MSFFTCNPQISLLKINLFLLKQQQTIKNHTKYTSLSYTKPIKLKFKVLIHTHIHTYIYSMRKKQWRSIKSPKNNWNQTLSIYVMAKLQEGNREKQTEIKVRRKRNLPSWSVHGYEKIRSPRKLLRFSEERKDWIFERELASISRTERRRCRGWRNPN